MSRIPLIDNLDLREIPNFEFDTVRPDAIPDRVINAVRLALADGEKFDSSTYANKRITIRGHFYASSRAEYEKGRDALLSAFESDVVTRLEFEQSDEQRQYYGTYENIIFDFKESGFVLVNIVYRATDPFGQSVALSTFYDSNVTDEIYEVIETGGNIYALPKISMTVNGIDDDEADRTLSMTIAQGSKTYNIQITRAWSAGESMVIDSKKQRVYVNGRRVDYSGRLPLLYKTNTFRFNFTDAASFDVDLNISYNKRWL